MLNAVAVLFAVGACLVTGHWYRGRVDGLGRKVAYPTTWVGLLLVLAVLAGAPGMLKAALEDRLSGVVSEVAGKSVRVRCQGLGAAAIDTGSEYGYVQYKQDGTPVTWTLIKRDQCNDLNAYLRSNKRNPGVKRVIAVHVLTHEAMHLASITNEAQAECAAVQRDALTARLLGASPQDAAALARVYYALVYPRMDPDYKSSECRLRGELDEGGDDAPWAASA